MKDNTERYKQKQKDSNTDIWKVVEKEEVRKKYRKLDGHYRMINRKQREDKENERELRRNVTEGKRYNGNRKQKYRMENTQVNTYHTVGQKCKKERQIK